MPSNDCQLTLAFTYPESGGSAPAIAVRDADGRTLARLPTQEPLPALPLADGEVSAITALDVLEHVHDEQAWLSEFARVLRPHGELVARVPLENWMAWADALNVSRYIADVTGVGAEPFETLPTGWHRHYHPDDLPSLMNLAGFETERVTTQGTPILEIPQLVALLAGNVLGHHAPQRRVHLWLERFRTGPRLPLPPRWATTITVRARKDHDGLTPGPDLGRDRDTRPESGDRQPVE